MRYDNDQFNSMEFLHNIELPDNKSKEQFDRLMDAMRDAYHQPPLPTTGRLAKNSPNDQHIVQPQYNVNVHGSRTPQDNGARYGVSPNNLIRVLNGTAHDISTIKTLLTDVQTNRAAAGTDIHIVSLLAQLVANLVAPLHTMVMYGQSDLNDEYNHRKVLSEVEHLLSTRKIPKTHQDMDHL